MDGLVVETKPIVNGSRKGSWIFACGFAEKYPTKKSINLTLSSLMARSVEVRYYGTYDTAITSLR